MVNNKDQPACEITLKKKMEETIKQQQQGNKCIKMAINVPLFQWSFYWNFI